MALGKSPFIFFRNEVPINITFTEQLLKFVATSTSEFHSKPSSPVPLLSTPQVWWAGFYLWFLLYDHKYCLQQTQMHAVVHTLQDTYTASLCKVKTVLICKRQESIFCPTPTLLHRSFLELSCGFLRMLWIRVEWVGLEWSGLEWAVLEWNILEWSVVAWREGQNKCTHKGSSL